MSSPALLLAARAAIIVLYSISPSRGIRDWAPAATAAAQPRGIGVDLGVVLGVAIGDASKLKVVGEMTPLNGLMLG